MCRVVGHRECVHPMLLHGLQHVLLWQEEGHVDRYPGGQGFLVHGNFATVEVRLKLADAQGLVNFASRMPMASRGWPHSQVVDAGPPLP
eukprot:15446680-Alexandrium_andersonii.AAC.1